MSRNSVDVLGGQPTVVHTIAAIRAAAVANAESAATVVTAAAAAVVGGHLAVARSRSDVFESVANITRFPRGGGTNGLTDGRNTLELSTTDRELKKKTENNPGRALGEQRE